MLPVVDTYTPAKTFQYTCFSLLSAILKTRVDDLFFYPPPNIDQNHENPLHRDTLKTYYEKVSVLWESCALGRDYCFNEVKAEYGSRSLGVLVGVLQTYFL